jgi:hypothetical protein
MNKLDEALGLFPSAIKSGEDWSPMCQAVLEAAQLELKLTRELLDAGADVYAAFCMTETLTAGQAEALHDYALASNAYPWPQLSSHQVGNA